MATAFFFLVTLFVAFSSLNIHSVNAFVPTSSSLRIAGTNNKPSSSSSLALFGPKQALSMEKMKNPKQVEATIQNLMKTKRLTREQAENRYGEFLLDPDGFALRAAAEQRKEKGYKNWEEQAIAESDDPEGTRKRIEEFKKTNSIKGTAIIFLFFTAVSIYNGMHPYVPPGSVVN